MSGIQPITYQELADTVRNFVTSNCTNVSNYSSLPSCFKSGYSDSSRIGGNDFQNVTVTYTITKSVPSISSSIVTSEFNGFLNQCGMNMKLSQNLSSNNFFVAFNNFVSFVATKVAVAISQFSSQSYLIYIQNSGYRDLITPSTELDNRLATATDVPLMLNAIIDTARQNFRCFACQYSVSIS